MLPNPVDAFGSLITEITAVEVPAQEEHKNNFSTVAAAQLRYLGSLLLPTLVCVRKITGRLRLDEYRQGVWGEAPGFDRRVNSYVNQLPVFKRPGYIQVKRETPPGTV